MVPFGTWQPACGRRSHNCALQGVAPLQLLQLGFAALLLRRRTAAVHSGLFPFRGWPPLLHFFGPFMGIYLRVVQYLIVSGFLFQAFCQQGGQVPYSTGRTRLAQIAPQAENTRKVFAQWFSGWSANTEDSSLEGYHGPEGSTTTPR